MKKKLLALILTVVMVLAVVVGLVACEKDPQPTERKTSITVWVSETEGIKTLTEQQIKAFLDANAEYKEKYSVTVEGISESEAATKMVTDVASGADIFCFAQDQLGRLIEANALSKLGVQAAKFVADNNDAGAVRAAKNGEDTYCYPITSDNGYFMYYDKSVITNPEHLNDLATLVADCEAANKKFAFELEGSAWYNASFFFGAGCVSTWRLNSETKKWTVTDTFNSEKGLVALKGMQILTKSTAYVNSSKAVEFGSAGKDENGNDVIGGAAIVVTGTWDSAKAQELLGNNYAVAKLPSFKVDGKTYQLGSYSGNKLLGVKPHQDTAVQAFCHALAQHLSGKDAQEARFDEKGWGPSNKEVQAMDKVKANEALAALAAQNAYAVPQGTIHGGWWDVAKLLGTVSKNAADDAALQKGLDDYKAALDKFEKMSEDALAAFGIVGAIASLKDTTENLAETQEKWADWNADLAMVKSEGANGAVIWTSKVAVALTTDDMFKIRQGQGWDVQYGSANDDALVANTDTAAKAKTPEGEGGNFKVAANGTYTIVLTIAKDGTGTIKLVAAQ